MRLLKLEIAQRFEKDVLGHYDPPGEPPYRQHWVAPHKEVWYESVIEVEIEGRVLKCLERHDEFSTAAMYVRHDSSNAYIGYMHNHMRQRLMQALEAEIFGD